MTSDFDLKHRSLRDEGDKLIISGIASNWDIDREGEALARSAFDQALHRYLSTNPILLYGHRFSMPLGKVVKAFVDHDGLHVTAELIRPEPGTEARNIFELVKAGILRVFSVGGFGTRKMINGVKTVTAWDLREISIAVVGVNPGTLFSLQVGKCFGDPIDADTAGMLPELKELSWQTRVLATELSLDRAANLLR